MTHPRFLVLPLALLAAALVGVLATSQVVAGDDDPPVPPPVDDPSLDAREQLAARYAPVLYLPQQSARCAADGTPFSPAPVEIVLEQPGVVLRAPNRAPVTTAPSAGDIFELDRYHYLDFPGNPLSPGCRYELDYLERSQDYPPVTYVNITDDENHPGIVVQYWFFYYFNDWNNNHEGDWEMMQIVFDVDSVEEAHEVPPDRVSYAQHGGGERVDWESDRISREDGRPVVYVANGSHASQYSPQVYLGKGDPGTGFGCDDATAPHRRVAPEPRLLPESVDSADDEYAWLTFDGRWGERLGGHNNGPTGPHSKHYFHNPLTWEETHRDGSVALPGSGILDMPGVGLFCDVTALGANVLLSFADQPVLIGTSVVLVAGAAVTAAIALALAVIRSGSSSLYGPDSFREARSVGQLIRASAHIYRLYWRTLVPMSVIFIPVGAAVALLQQLLLAIPPIGALFDLAGDRGLSALATVIYGYGANLPAFVLVTAGVIAAMHQLESGRRPSLAESGRIVARHAIPVLVARIRAVIIVALLFASIIGIPLAMYFMVRWLFIEETIVLSGSRFSHAAARSATLVYGHWWRTFFMVAILGAVGGFFTPFLVLSLIMWSPLPLGLINVMSALAYAALLPFIGIMLAFLYWDLSARYARRTGLDPQPA